MKLANRVLLCALAIFVLAAIASAQAKRLENDPRNQSPTVGTGGPVGGPTGLFTIYDGDTLRRGEFTISIGYSNYDRDPGDLDITDKILSVNVGVNNHLELFFSTTAYRGIKANSPLQLSGFYLPNSRVFFSGTATGSPMAIVIAPGQTGSASGAPIFRPPFCPACAGGGGLPAGFFFWGQPFVGYPFTGGVGPTFGLSPGQIGSQFGFPGFTTTILGAPIIGSGGNFGAASAYPGVGAPVGGILPGVVLAARLLPATNLTLPIVVPTVFTTSPSYYPGAPFLNRLYGESSFDDFSVGAKWRLTGPNNPFGFGLIPFYRFYLDKPDDASGFNQMQRGAGPGAHIGDFGLVMFASGRLSRSVNLSANLGYILNSNPKGPAGDVLLDRPDEVIAGVGFDFPINKHFQPVAELRSTEYVAGRTRNAFQNNPVEVLAGIKIYPARWWGLAAWYRAHLNQQSSSHFGSVSATATVNQVTGVTVIGRPGGPVVVPATSVALTASGAPLGFRFSDNPSGYGGQVWFGHRNAREPAILPNQPPVVSLAAATTTITLPCPPGQTSATCPAAPAMSTALVATATDPDGDTLLYTWSVTGGRVTGDGANVSWDLSGVGAGTYTATVEVDDGCGCVSFATATVTVAACADCVTPPPPCPTVSVSCPDQSQPDQPITFTANVSGGPGTQTYNWSVSSGTIASGQGTSSITVTGAAAGSSVTATVELGGLDPNCARTASCTTQIAAPPPLARKFDTYGNIRFNDEKARLDNFAIQLQNEPSAQGYIIGYGTCDAEGQNRANRARDYLVNTRGIDASRIVVVDGGCMPELRVDLWIVPSGATAPAADTTGAVSPCPDCKKPRGRRGRRGRGEE